MNNNTTTTAIAVAMLRTWQCYICNGNNMGCKLCIIHKLAVERLDELQQQHIDDEQQ